MQKLAIAALALSASQALATNARAVTETPPPQSIKQCEALADMQITAQQIGLPTRGARITSATRIEAAEPRMRGDEQLLALPAYCRVQGTIIAMSDGAPSINFNLNLPLVWNGVAVQSGGGGLGGNLNTAPDRKGSGMIDPESPAEPYRLTKGYVVFGSDEGHQQGDISFFKSDEAMRNWASDYIKKVRDTAVAIIDSAYGMKPRRLYFTGESAGGREAMRAAQRFGGDYDGFIATSPVIAWSLNHLTDNRTRSLLIDGWIDSNAIRVIADASREICDAADGLKDGVVARYLQCEIPDARLACRPGQTSACLTAPQLVALHSLRRGYTLPDGMSVAHGITRFLGYGITGNEDGETYQYPFYPIGTVMPSRDLPPGLGFEKGRGAILNFGAAWVRNAIVQNDSFNPYGFDPRPFKQRIAYLSGLFDATDPDLSALEKQLGKDRTRASLRFYVGPGGGHNVTGTGHLNLLDLLEDWVDRGIEPPTQLTAQKVDDTTLKVMREMPACEYPAYAHYMGGDPDKVGSFVCRPRRGEDMNLLAQ